MKDQPTEPTEPTELELEYHIHSVIFELVQKHLELATDNPKVNQSPTNGDCCLVTEWVLRHGKEIVKALGMDEAEMAIAESGEDARRLEMLVGSAALAKACQDPFDYAMKLRTGEVIDFTEARVLNKDWVHLEIKPPDEQPKANRIAYQAVRGIDVRLSDIIWVMDAPRGS